jgi:hypothetical protein
LTLEVLAAKEVSVSTPAFGGGQQTGPSPVDRRKKGTKHSLVVDWHGAQLVIPLAGANTRNPRELVPLVVEFPKWGGKNGRH